MNLHKRDGLIISIILILGIFYIATIRDGHNWGSDFSMYIHHAKNIVEGIPYDDTGYIVNPFNPTYGPKSYPPVFPFLLVPAYAWLGLNLNAMKAELILIFMLSLYMIHLALRNDIPVKYNTFIILIIGFNPFFWDFKDNILADFPFLLFSYSSLFLWNHIDPSGGMKSRNPIFLGVLCYLAYGTRGIGIVFPISFIIYDLIRFKRLTCPCALVLGTFLPLALLQSVLEPSQTSYISQFEINPGSVLQNLRGYFFSFSLIWDNGYSRIIKFIVFVVFSMFSLYGFLTKVRGKLTLLEIYLILYLMVIIVWPSFQGPRFLIPLFPLYIYYAFVGLQKMTTGKRDIIKSAIIITLMITIFGSYLAKYTQMDFGPIKEGILKRETVELFEYIKAETSKEDVFVFWKPRVLSLFTGRPASCYHETERDEDLRTYFKRIGARYIIESLYWDEPYFRNYIRRSLQNLELVYHNSDFRVFKIR